MNTSSNFKMGAFIRKLREKKGMTQLDLAKLLHTTQSAVARMEKGEQNFTTEMLQRISVIFNRPLVKVAPESLDFRIEGGRTLSGEIVNNTSKNGATGLLCASLLNEGKTVLHGMPRLEEVSRMLEVMDSIGISTKWIGKNSIEIKVPKKLALDKVNSLSWQKTRSVIMFLGPLIHLYPEFVLPNAGGCKLGKRTIAAHIYGMEKLGAQIEVTDNSYIVKRNKLSGEEVIMYESGDTATENIIMLAAKIPGVTTIKFASCNYMVQDVCHFVEALGVKIEGIGTTTLTVHGVEKINLNVEHYNSEDPIETMMFLCTAIMTKSNIKIKRCPIDFLELELLKLEKMGFKYKRSVKYKSANGKTDLVDIETFPSTLVALDEKLYARPYPGLNIDNLPFFVPIATQAKGRTLIHDWVFENRAIYYMELAKMGAGMILADTHRVYIDGPSKLKSAQIVCPPALRPGMIIMIAMLAAEGTSILRNVYSIARGYEEIAERLNSLGANIEVINDGI